MSCLCGTPITCLCGQELSEMTVQTHGLCPRCSSSIWMQVARRTRPNTDVVIARLESSHATVCEHGWNPCIARCCVRYVSTGLHLVRDGTGHWEPIPEDERQAWFSRVLQERLKLRTLELLELTGELDCVVVESETLAKLCRKLLEDRLGYVDLRSS